MTKAGTSFSTGNSTVAKLPAGSTLKVLGNGQVQIVSVPEPTFAVGDKIFVSNKGRYGRIVRMTAVTPTFAVPANSVLYVSDDNVVRIAQKSNVQKV